MVAANGKERRKYVRVGFKTAIHIVIDANGEKIHLDGNSKDLSIRGIFVSTPKKLPAGTACKVKVYLTGGIDDIELSINATIVREAENGMGIEFDSMDVDTYTHLKNIVYYNNADEIL